ncbi:MAG: MaoC family dehydratase [Litorimonas sp.]
MPAIKVSEIAGKVGETMGTSDWIEVGQERINQFAECTGDHQFIHVNPEMAKMTPFGTTIAHGFLSLSLLPLMSETAAASVEGARMGVNYGLNKLRFITPVKNGKKVRGHFKLTGYDEKAPGQHLLTQEVTVEIEGEDKPALVAETLTLLFT